MTPLVRKNTSQSSPNVKPQRYNLYNVHIVALAPSSGHVLIQHI